LIFTKRKEKGNWWDDTCRLKAASFTASRRQPVGVYCTAQDALFSASAPVQFPHQGSIQSEWLWFGPHASRISATFSCTAVPQARLLEIVVAPPSAFRDNQSSACCRSKKHSMVSTSVSNGIVRIKVHLLHSISNQRPGQAGLRWRSIRAIRAFHFSLPL
jgi:hypothetical protein